MLHEWCNAAQLRRDQIESGIDITFVDVFRPLFVEWVQSINPNTVLEVGAGTGHLSKSLSDQSFSITAVEPSPGMYEVARHVLSDTGVELWNCSSFEFQADASFDMAIAHLVAHTVHELEGFLKSIQETLEKEGRLIFSIPHPCFYNAYKKLFGNDYRYMTPMRKRVSFTVTNDPDNEISDVPYYHRPLSVYIQGIRDAGFVLDGFHEVYPDEEIQRKYGSPWETPRYCALFCRCT